MNHIWLNWASELQSIAQAGETLDAGFFESDKLPELSFTRNTPEQIKLCFEAKKCEVFETIFD